MNEKKLYIFELELARKTPKFTTRAVIVKETDKTFRLIRPEPPSTDKHLTAYRSIVNKSELNVLIHNFSSSYEMLSEDDNLDNFKEAIRKSIDEKRKALYKEIDELDSREKQLTQIPQERI